MSNWTGYNGALIGQCGTTTYEVITDAGSYTMASGPTLSATPTTVSGFLQFVGTPSAEQTVDVSGMDLTADAVITVTSGDYQISSLQVLDSVLQLHFRLEQELLLQRL